MPLCLNCPYISACFQQITKRISIRVLSMKCISSRVQTGLNSEAVNNTNWPSNKLDMRFNVQMKCRPRFSFSSVHVHMWNTCHAFIQNMTQICSNYLCPLWQHILLCAVWFVIYPNFWITVNTNSPHSNVFDYAHGWKLQCQRAVQTSVSNYIG